MPNHLIHEKSPYLLQHAHNPVDWYPWGAAAFEKADRENKPVFLSIGYATCHWCHVMAHESFEDPEVAVFLNRHYVAVKVDREERPDIDAVYMAACQALTGQGGWPLSVFLTPDKKPFYAGTYFPKAGRFGLPGFLDILRKIAELWTSQPGKIREAANQVVGLFKDEEVASSHPERLSEGALVKAYAQLRGAFDARWAGFGSAPKFPTPHNLTFLLRWHRYKKSAEAREMAERTLKAMRYGGIFDQVGYGFHRYSVDAAWRVPHFEKMLYDQALLMAAYAEAAMATGDGFYGQVVREIFSYVQREMTHPGGGFYSAQDADSEGKEGFYYLWTPGEVTEILGKDDGALLCRYYDITAEGNFEEGKSIPRVPVPPERFAEREGIALETLEETLRRSRKRLLEARARRVPPLKDDKILTSWNGLMIAALAYAGRATGTEAYISAAVASAAFIQDALWRDGRLFHRFRDGDMAVEGLLEDYAFLAWGILELFEATFESRYLERAVDLCGEMRRRFWDTELGGYFSTSLTASELPYRRKEVYDGALPSANSAALWVHLRLAALTGDTAHAERADILLRTFAGKVSAAPMGHTQFLSGLFYSLGPSREIIVSGNSHAPRVREMLEILRRRYDPHAAVLVHDPADARLTGLCPFLADYPALEDNKAAAYVCEKGMCKAPVGTVEGLIESFWGYRAEHPIYDAGKPPAARRGTPFLTKHQF